MLGNALFPRQPQQCALHVAFVVLQRLLGQASGDLMQLGEIGSDGAVSGGDHLKRLVQRLGDLPERCRPVSLDLLGKLLRRGDDRDAAGERRLDQDGGLGHWDHHSCTRDGWGFP
jgi:hypothetical protein